MLPYFKIFDNVIYTYPLMMGLAWGVAYNFFKYLHQILRIDFKKSNIYFWAVFVFSWIGAKVFFILTTSSIAPEKYALSANFWLGGGFVFYGGLVFGLLFTYFFLKFTKQEKTILGIIVPPLALGHALGRIGCFLAGCCYGKYWHNGPMERYPVQLEESLGLIIICLISVKLLKKGKSVFGFYIISYSILRFTLEFYRGDLIRGIWYSGLSTSQIVALVLALLSLVGLVFQKIKQRVD